MQGLNVTPVPGHLNGVADGPLYPGRGGVELLCNLRVQHLGDGVDHVHILDGEDDGLPEILVALDVGGHANLVDDVGDNSLQVCLLPPGHRLLTAVHAGGGHTAHITAAPKLADAGQQGGDITRLGHEIVHAPDGAVTNDLVVDKAGEDDDAAVGPCLRQAAQQLQAIQLGQHQIHQQHVRLQLRQQAERFHAVRCCAYHFKIGFPAKSFADKPAEVLIRVGDENAGFGFHNFILPLCNVRSFLILKKVYTP